MLICYTALSQCLIGMRNVDGGTRPAGQLSNDSSTTATSRDSAGTRTEHMNDAPQQKPSNTISSGGSVWSPYQILSFGRSASSNAYLSRSPIGEVRISAPVVGESFVLHVPIEILIRFDSPAINSNSCGKGENESGPNRWQVSALSRLSDIVTVPICQTLEFWVD